jgi:hypothetical protein
MAAMITAANHIITAKQTAGANDPPRLRKLAGSSETYAENTRAHPTIMAELPKRGRMKKRDMTQTTEEYG